MNRSSGVPQPIPYQGSKRRLAPQILRYFPRKFDRLVEPFAGSAAVSIAAAAGRRARSFWINDANGPLVELWRQIIEAPDALATGYETLWHDQLGRERDYFQTVRSRFNQSHESADLLYLLARCVKAAIRYNASGQFNNTADNRRKGTRPAEMRRRIECVSELLRDRTALTSLDYRQLLAKCRKSDVIYMDPPYQGVSGGRDQRYLPTVVHDEFCDVLECLTARGIMYAVSYDGRTGDKTYGQSMPESLRLRRFELRAGRSAQSTLLGRDHDTIESFYVSPALAAAAGF